MSMTAPTTEFNTPFDLLVRRRYSCRTFSERKIDPPELRRLKAFLERSSAVYPGSIRLELASRSALKKENLFTTGAYGLIKGFHTFIAGIIQKNRPRIWLDFGGLMERALMAATDLGLDSCWIGGVFDRKTAGRALGIDQGETVPAIIALGYGAEKKSIRDRLTRWSARGDRRKPWEKLFFQDSPPHPFPADKYPGYRPLLENVRRAPSASNKQPWRIVFVDRDTHRFHFFLCRDKIYGKLVPRVDLQQIDLGIGVFHFRQSARENGVTLRTVRDNPGLPDLPPNYEYMISFDAGH